MGKADYLALGDWNVQCYRCGRKFKASMMKKYWQGFWVCEADWEPRHPQDFVRNTTDQMTSPWSQPWPAATFLMQDPLIAEVSPDSGFDFIYTESGDLLTTE